MRVLSIILILLVGGCVSTPMPTVPHVDLPRFMGRWYVLAHVPAGLERDAYGATETYQLAQDGTIDTTYAFNRGSFDGPVRSLRARGFVHDPATNADWRMQFLWPFRHEYLITDLDAAYTTVIVARTKRDWAWIMARDSSIPDDELERLIDRLVELGYDRSRVRRVPQRPADAPRV